MNKHITSFLKNNALFTLATTVEDNPYCAICFYAFDEKHNQLVFKSSLLTRHVQEALANTKVAGTIQMAETKISILKGIQFTGSFEVPEGDCLERLKNVYYKKHPLSVLYSGVFFAINLEYVKMTDNAMGMGKKLVWEPRPESIGMINE
jgi:uncharacterized protein